MSLDFAAVLTSVAKNRWATATCRVWRLGAVGVAVLGMTLASSHRASASEVPDAFFGVSDPNFFVMSQKGEDGALDSYLSHIKAAGIGWVRDAVPWPDPEPVPPVGDVHTYRWGAFDDQVTRYAEHRLTLQPVIRQTPGWAEDPAAI